MARSRPPSANAAAGAIFHRFPLGCPLTALLLGLMITVIAFYVHSHMRSGLMPLYLAVGPVLFSVGLVVLPFGIATAAKRRRCPIVLTCPKCGAISRESSRPFSVERWNDVPYAYVVCSRCGTDFTVDKYARLL